METNLVRCGFSGWRVSAIALAGLVVSPALADDSLADVVTEDRTVVWDHVSLELRSGLGGPNRSWSIFSDGGGHWRQAVYPNTPGRNYTLNVHRIDDSPERYIELERILSRLPEPAPSDSDCRNFMRHMGGGTIRLSRSVTTIEISFTLGCRDEAYLEFIELLLAADELVSQAGRASTLLRTERYENGQLVRRSTPE